MKKRCDWCGNDPLYVKYHDEEWGLPVHDDRKLFELLVLEGAQAGLSWITILRKRENYRKAFDNFDIVKVSSYGEQKITELLQNSGIVRNKLKIRSTVTNAREFIRVQDEFGSFDNYIWSFTGGDTVKNSFRTVNELPATSSISDTMEKDLKRRGFKFCGSTICYAYMQSIGMVNDHIVDCFRYRQV